MEWRQFLFDTSAGLWLAAQANGSQAAKDSAVRIRIVDAATKKPLVARVRLQDARGAEVIPLGRNAQPAKDAVEGNVRFQSRGYFYTDGTLTVRSDAFPLRFTVVRGYEYQIAEGTLQAGAVKDGVATIELQRWSSVGRESYYSGDVHIHHISPKTCRLEMEAEDLDVAHIVTSDFTADQHEFEGRLNAHSGGRFVYVSQEFRHDHLGHMCVLDLKKPVQPVKPMQREHYPLHLSACDSAHAQGGYVTWAHFPSWPGVESPLEVVMEKLDGIELLSVLDPREPAIFVPQVIPEVQANNGLHLWYRYLNCGFHLTASAGTDKMTTFVTVGSNRVYVQVDDEFTYDNWMRGLRRGRTFVTNSPMLRFTVNGRPPGDLIDVAPRRSVVQIHVSAQSHLPYDRLEIVVNGSVVADASPSGSRNRADIKLEYTVKESCWIAARALEDSNTYRAKSVDLRAIHQDRGTLHGDYYGTRRPETVFAHTSPVYLLRDGQPIRSQEDAEYYVRYLESAIAWLDKEGRFARPSDKTATLEAFRAGQRLYRRRAEEATQSRVASLGRP
jgi:TolB protein